MQLNRQDRQERQGKKSRDSEAWLGFLLGVLGGLGGSILSFSPILSPSLADCPPQLENQTL
jgi:hypothetical protein